MTEGNGPSSNGNAWENWERNTEESHEYADFIFCLAKCGLMVKKEVGMYENEV